MNIISPGRAVGRIGRENEEISIGFSRRGGCRRGEWVRHGRPLWSADVRLPRRHRRRNRRGGRSPSGRSASPAGCRRRRFRRRSHRVCRFRLPDLCPPTRGDRRVLPSSPALLARSWVSPVLAGPRLPPAPLSVGSRQNLLQVNFTPGLRNARTGVF